jgi:YD repeat-containing protein
MKKYFVYILFISQLINAQDRKETQNYLPEYTPPSPSVAAFMKFEEVPVNNYTGLPDVNIPLYSILAKDQKLKVDINLKYHPSSTAVDEIASDVGLGWSLFAGGTISRTVMSLPDEILLYSKKIGIYHTNVSGSINNYYNVQEIISNGIQNQNEQEIVNEFLWEASEKNKYDTQHDLWQFNFMGFTGRFYIKKNTSSGALEIIPLENYNLKIINHYNNSNDYLLNPYADVIYTPISFEIIDTNGYKYIFDEFEETKVIPFSYNEFNGNLSTYNFADPLITKKYRSSFHLSKILDMDNKVLVEYKYYDQYNESYITGSSIIHNLPTNFSGNDLWFSNFMNRFPLDPFCPEGGESNIKKLEPISASSSTQYEINVKKINTILINDVAKIHFSFTEGREDFCYFNSEKGCKLIDVEVKTWNEDKVKKYKFDYFYNEIFHKKLFLKKIGVFDKQNVFLYDYEFGYENEGKNASDFIGNIGKDYWGYYNLTSNCDLGTKSLDVTPNFCTSDILQKVKLPTGGCQIFEYEPNDYSYIVTNPITNFDENNDNWEIQSNYLQFSMASINGNEQFQSLGYSNEERIFIFNSTINNNQTIAGFLKLYKIEHFNLNQTRIFVTYLRSDYCPLELKLEAGFDYVIGFTWDANAELGENPVGNLPNNGSAFINISYKKKTINQKKLLYGGGIRIKKIGYFISNVNKEYYKWYDYYSQFDVPSKELNYNYRSHDDPTKSSGILVFPKPIYSYPKSVKTCLYCTPYNGNTEMKYQTTTTFNNLLANKTKGSDVGYKNVCVYESLNGKAEYEYTTFLDYPELQFQYSITPPFHSIENNDFKFGLLKSEKIYNNNNKLLKKIVNNYEIIEYIRKTGVKVFSNPENQLSNSYKFENYATFNLLKSICSDPANFNFNCTYGGIGVNPGNVNNPSFPECPCICYKGESVSDIISFIDINQKYGWVKLNTKTSFDYYYDSNNNQTFVENITSYNYNLINKLVSEIINTNSSNESIITKYFYSRDGIINSDPFINELRENNIIETPLLTQVFLNNTTNKISEHKTLYGKWHNILLPQSIQTSKGSQSLDTKVVFENYDQFSHPLQVRKENGMFISYIWGYNKTKPIAKIENIKYSQIDPNLILAVQNASNNSFDGTEPALISALNDLRAALPEAMVTTYTYKPLVGIRTITNPKGDVVTYDYDDFGRLIKVYDSQGNPVSENEYHYRTQN